MSYNQNRRDERMKTGQGIVIGLIIGFLAGVGTMQASLIGDVRDHAVRLSHIESDLTKQQQATETRIQNVVRLMEGLLETNRELISVIKNRP
jgi:hypothetical protein